MRPIVATDLMNSVVLKVQSEMPVEDLAAFLVKHRISGAPVFDGPDRLVGLVSLFDVVEVLGDLPSEGDEPEDSIDDTERLTVADIMTEAVRTVAEDASVEEVASTILHHHLHRVLVMRGDQVVGIISTSDLLGLLVEPM